MLLKIIRNRFFIFSLAVVFVFVALGYRLSYLTVAMGEYFYGMAQESKKIELDTRGARGNILDRTGIPLAANRHYYIAQIDRQWLPRGRGANSEINVILGRAIEILEGNGDKIVDNLPIKYGDKVYSDNIMPYLVDGFYYDFNTQNAEIFKSRYDRWRKDSNIKVDLPADEMFEVLRNSFEIDDSIPDELARKIISIRLDLYQSRGMQYVPIVIAEDISMKSVTRLETIADELMGIQITIEAGRYYPNGQTAPHIIGYVGKISESNIAQYARENEGRSLKEDGYNIFRDKYGQSGVEAYAEQWLTGSLKERQGKLEAEVNASRRVIRLINETLPQNGHDVILTLDSRLQRAAEHLLAEELKKMREGLPPYTGDRQAPLANTGAIVLMDVNTGEILAMASYANSKIPYDLNQISYGLTRQQEQALSEDPYKPLLSYAYQGAEPPGSTFKMVVAMGALMENKIKVNETIYDRLTYYVERPGLSPVKGPDSWNMKYSFGNIDVKDAIKVSSNYFFSAAGHRLGLDGIYQWAKKYGLDDYTGLEIMTASENRSSVSNKDKVRPAEVIHETLQASIGQGTTVVTPLAMARYIAALVNGGKVLDTHVIKEVRSFDGELIKRTEPVYTQLDIKQQYADEIKEGMRRVIYAQGGPGGNGTAMRTFTGIDPAITLGGKTGTATKVNDSPERNTIWFAGFTPYEEPEVSVVIMIPNGNASNNSVYIARRMLEEYHRIMNSDLDNPLPVYNELVSN